LLLWVLSVLQITCITNEFLKLNSGAWKRWLKANNSTERIKPFQFLSLMSWSTKNLNPCFLIVLLPVILLFQFPVPYKFHKKQLSIRTLRRWKSLGLRRDFCGSPPSSLFLELIFLQQSSQFITYVYNESQQVSTSGVRRVSGCYTSKSWGQRVQLVSEVSYMLRWNGALQGWEEGLHYVHQ